MLDIYTVDIESYYDRDFSLSKLTTERYVRDPQFEAILLGIKKNNGPVKWVPKPLIEGFLKALDFSKSAILCHNTAFDGAILSWHYGVKPKLWLDTLSMARPLHNVTVGGSLKALAQYYKLGVKGDEVINAMGKRYADFSKEELARYADYCVNDVELTYQLWLRLKKELPPSELLVIDQTMRMYTQPMIELDVPLLEKHLSEVRQRKEDALRELATVVGMGEKFDPTALKALLMSNHQFAKLLSLLGVDPPMKVSARTGKDTYAFSKTDQAFLALLEHPDERVRAMAEARLGTKSTLEETRTEAFIGIAGRGPLPIMLNYYGAHTGRFSGGDKVNLQNLPSRGNTTIRQALKAPEGYEIIACDSSQIEARTVAWLAGQDDLVQAFREGRDVYSEFASEVYGRTITKADYTERFVGKTCIAEGTLVLTDSGWKPIEKVSTADQVWDGVQWVWHHGVVNNGIKPTLNLCGAWLTPDHQVLCGTQWLEAQSVVADEDTLFQVLDTGAENLPSQATLLGSEAVSVRSSSGAIAAITSTTSEGSLISKPVYDILNSGSRNRFTILTEAGPVIVHNCILGLGYGMGADKFRKTLALAKIYIDENEAERIVRLYRQKYWKIVQLWQTCGQVLKDMVGNRSGTLKEVITYDKEGIRLPNHLRITYPALRQTKDGFQYINDARTYRKALKDRVAGGTLDDLPWVKIYGGKVTENIVQALAGIIVRWQMTLIGQAGHFVAFQVHDENVCVVPTASAEAAEAEIIRIMSTPPVWAPDLPVACESGRADNYGDC